MTQRLTLPFFLLYPNPCFFVFFDVLVWLGPMRTEVLKPVLVTVVTAKETLLIMSGTVAVIPENRLFDAWTRRNREEIVSIEGIIYRSMSESMLSFSAFLRLISISWGLYRWGSTPFMASLQKFHGHTDCSIISEHSQSFCKVLPFFLVVHFSSFVFFF